MNAVVINSIGTATPSVSKILSDAFKLPQEYILKLLYNTPSVLFNDVDLKLAEQAETTLSQLGLDVKIVDDVQYLIFKKEKFDISIDIENPLKFPILLQQLSSFLGCKQSEVLNLILTEPGIILGGVSKSTALALENFIDGKVCYSIPQHDLYSILVDADKKTVDQIQGILNIDLIKEEHHFSAENISYKSCQKLWNQFGKNKKIKIINQSHQKVNLELVGFDINNNTHTDFLKDKIGIPKEILNQISNELPILLFERMSFKNARSFSKNCEEVGLKTRLTKNNRHAFKIKVSNIKNLDLVQKILAQFNSKSDLPNGTTWESQKEIPAVIANYLLAQLQLAGCQPQLI